MSHAYSFSALSHDSFDVSGHFSLPSDPLEINFNPDMGSFVLEDFLFIFHDKGTTNHHYLTKENARAYIYLVATDYSTKPTRLILECMSSAPYTDVYTIECSYLFEGRSVKQLDDCILEDDSFLHGEISVNLDSFTVFKSNIIPQL